MATVDLEWHGPRGVKRKASQYPSPSCPPASPNSEGSRYSANSSDGEEDELFESNTTTPLTAPSPKSPRHPSDVNKVHICTFEGCNKAFNRPAKLEQHVRSHTNVRPFVCSKPECGKDFLRLQHLKHHIQSAHSNVRNHVCIWQSCGKSFVTATRLRRHMSTHEGENKFTCKVNGCGETFRKHLTLQAHNAKVHEGKKPFTCAFLGDDGLRCNAGFDTAYKLKDHEGRLHAVNRYTCVPCTSDGNQSSQSGEGPVAFSTYSALQQHLAREHPPTCADCGLKCHTQADLKSHVEVAHGLFDLDERRNHVCPKAECGAGFTTKGNLNVHIQSVHGKKRFLCGDIASSELKGLEGWDRANACGATFTTKKRLIVHIRNTHCELNTKPAPKPKKAKKEKRARTKISAIDRLTGSSSGEVLCLVPGCTSVFVQDSHHLLHLKSKHRLSEREIDALRAKANGATEELYPRPTLRGYSEYVTEEDLAAERAFDVDIESQLLAAVEEEGEFWLGGHNEDMIGVNDQWFKDEMEIRQLIHDELGIDDGDVNDTPGLNTIDPKLT